MGPVWQNAIQRTVRTAHLSVLIIVHKCWTQHSMEQFWLCSRLTTAQILSIGGEGNVITKLFRSYYMLEQVVTNRAYVIVDNGSTFYRPDDVLSTNQQSKHWRDVMLYIIWMQLEQPMKHIIIHKATKYNTLLIPRTFSGHFSRWSRVSQFPLGSSSSICFTTHSWDWWNVVFNGSNVLPDTQSSKHCDTKITSRTVFYRNPVYAMH